MTTTFEEFKDMFYPFVNTYQGVNVLHLSFKDGGNIEYRVSVCCTRLYKNHPKLVSEKIEYGYIDHDWIDYDCRELILNVLPTTEKLIYDQMFEQLINNNLYPGVLNTLVILKILEAGDFKVISDIDIDTIGYGVKDLPYSKIYQIIENAYKEEYFD